MISSINCHTSQISKLLRKINLFSKINFVPYNSYLRKKIYILHYHDSFTYIALVYGKHISYMDRQQDRSTDFLRFLQFSADLGTFTEEIIFLQ